MFRRLLAILSLGSLAVPASAQVLPGLTVDGDAAAGLSSGQPGSAIARLDLTFGLPLQQRPNPRLRFELGLLAFVRDASHPHETYAALVWDEHLRIGVVRPAYDRVLISPFGPAVPRIEDLTLDSSRSYATIHAMRQTAVPIGLSWHGETDESIWDMSLHDAATGGFRALSLSFQHDAGAWQWAAAAEGVWSHDGDWHGANIKLGLRAPLGTGDVGLTLLHPDANDAPDAAEFDLSLPVSTRVSLSALAHLEGRRGTDRYGLATELALGSRDSLAVSASHGDGDDALHATLIHRF